MSLANQMKEYRKKWDRLYHKLGANRPDLWEERMKLILEGDEIEAGIRHLEKELLCIYAEVEDDG